MGILGMLSKQPFETAKAQILKARALGPKRVAVAGVDSEATSMSARGAEHRSRQRAVQKPRLLPKCDGGRNGAGGQSADRVDLPCRPSGSATSGYGARDDGVNRAGQREHWATGPMIDEPEAPSDGAQTQT